MRRRTHNDRPTKRQLQRRGRKIQSERDRALYQQRKTNG